MNSKILSVVALCLLTYGVTAKAASYTADPGAGWVGFMNVFNLPSNGGAYIFGSTWGVSDLTAVFNSPGHVPVPTLTLGVNSVNDPNAFWYTPSGQPGATGNKITDANIYQQNDTLVGQDVVFSFTVISNTLTSNSNYTSQAFIKDFAPDYSSFQSEVVDLTPGFHSIELQTIGQTGRHVQWGFETSGPDVWVTDRGNYGSVVIQTSPGDVNRDGHINSADITAMENEMAIGPAAYAAQLGYFNAGPPSLAALNAAIAQVTNSGDMNGDGVLNGADIQKLINVVKAGGGSLNAVPEPSSLVLLGLAGLGLAAAKKRLAA